MKPAGSKEKGADAEELQQKSVRDKRMRRTHFFLFSCNKKEDTITRKSSDCKCSLSVSVAKEERHYESADKRIECKRR